MKKIIFILMLLISFTVSVYADNTDLDSGKNIPQKDIVERIKSIQIEEQNKLFRNMSNMPKVAVMYINNAQTTYNDEIDGILLPALKSSINQDLYQYIEGVPYIERLKKVGIIDITTAERADIMEAFKGEDITFAVFLQVDPFIRKDKITFFTIGKEMTAIVSFKIIDIANNKYLYNGKFTEVAKDSSMIGAIGNKSVSLKALSKVSEQLTAVIDVRLPKNKIDK